MFSMPVHFGADSGSDTKSQQSRRLKSANTQPDLDNSSQPTTPLLVRGATAGGGMNKTGSSGAVSGMLSGHKGLHGGGSGTGKGSGDANEPQLTPLFHIKSRDACIMAMEHNAHFNVTALSLSTGDVVVVAMGPFASGQATGSSGESSAANGNSVRTSVNQTKFSLNSASYGDKIESLVKSSAKQGTEWNAMDHSATVTTLPSPCLQLAWAPWRYGLVLVCVCPGKAVQIFRYAMQQWSEELVSEQVMFCNAVSFAPNGVLACGCSKGRIVFLRKDNEEFGQPWRAIFRTGDGSTNNPGNSASGGVSASSSRSSVEDRDADKRKDCVSISWSDPGTMLAVGDQDSTVRIYDISSKADAFQLKLVYSHTIENRSALRQLSWAPSSARSFFILAVAASDHFAVLIFSTSAHAIARETSAGQRPVGPFQPERIGYALYPCNGAVNRGGSVATSGTDELLKLCWNGSGMKLGTTHADGSTRVYQLRIMYKETRGGASSTMTSAKAGTADPSDALIVDICEESRVSAPLCDDTVLLTVEQSPTTA